jgi:hypothetical protein
MCAAPSPHGAGPVRIKDGRMSTSTGIHSYYEVDGGVVDRVVDETDVVAGGDK